MSDLVSNKKARFDYELLDQYEAGIELTGREVKSLKNGQGSLLGAHIIIRGGEAFLVGTTIPPYQPANNADTYDPARPRRVLLTKKELATLAGQEKTKGLTIVPLSVYSKGKKVKLRLAVVKGKKKYDKRETLKKKDAKREIERTLKREYR
ncbi:MAG: SsrA-binding protein SmpB [Candidatus Paceibacterota bacterium]